VSTEARATTAKSLGLALAAVLAAAACAPPPPPPPTAVPTPLPTRAVLPTPVPTETPAPTPTPAPTRPAAITFTAKDFDPFWALYATERDGLFVTTRNPRGRYYYKWDDRRWFGLEDRVWFMTIEDLLTVFPSRVPAP
jgi:hypothetical protein